MFIYEKDRKLNVELNNTNQVPTMETPDIVILKDELTEILVDGKSISGGGDDPSGFKFWLDLADAEPGSVAGNYSITLTKAPPIDLTTATSLKIEVTTNNFGTTWLPQSASGASSWGEFDSPVPVPIFTNYSLVASYDSSEGDYGTFLITFDPSISIDTLEGSVYLPNYGNYAVWCDMQSCVGTEVEYYPAVNFTKSSVSIPFTPADADSLKVIVRGELLELPKNDSSSVPAWGSVSGNPQTPDPAYIEYDSSSSTISIDITLEAEDIGKYGAVRLIYYPVD